MFNPQANSAIAGSFMLLACLALFAGCGGSANSAKDGSTDEVTSALSPPPANVTATAGSAQAVLAWSTSSGATSYHVKRATTSGGPYSQVGAPTSNSYTDASLTNGTAYYYVVSSINAVGESANSAQVTATPQAPVAPPSAPTDLTATAANAQVSLTWTVSNSATSYRVKRATTNGGPYSQVGAPTSTSYTDSSLMNGTTYYYVISAVNSAGEGANSAQVNAAPVASASIPPVPTALSASPGDAQVALIWSTSNGATSYRVKRATTSGGPYSQVGEPTSASYTDGSLMNDTTYYYVVSAVNSAGASANSAQASARPAAPVSNPPPVAFGTWINVTPSGVILNNALGCGNYGTQSVQVDPSHPSNVYTLFMCQGIWKSTDYGATWSGPINTGTNGGTVGDCAGGITVAASSTGGVPTIYQSCIRGSAVGFWKSVDGGVNWTRYSVAPTNGIGRQDYYPVVVDPYDSKHLLMAGHEMDYIVESIDGGQNWTNVPIAAGMHENGGTGAIFFIDTGNASTSRATWLWMAQASGGAYGTWRTANSGGQWTQVDKNEHAHGASQLYQPDKNGVIFIAGVYSDRGWGVLRSTDYGQVWAHVGNNGAQVVVAGTSKNLYAMSGGPVGIGGVVASGFQIGAQPGTGSWVMPGTPAGLAQGSAQIAVTNDGTHNILLSASWNSGLWRYIEP